MARAWAAILGIPAALAGLIVLAMVLGVTASVSLRAITGAEIPGMVELTEIGLYLSAVLAAPWLLHRGGHIRADLLAPALPHAAGRAVEVTADALGLLVCLTLAYASVAVVSESAALGSLLRRTITFPEWWLSAPLPIVFALLAGEFAARILRLLRDPSATRREEAGSVG